MIGLPIFTVFEQADRLASIEEAQYRAAEVVIRRAADSSLVIYCMRSDWPHTEAGRLAVRDREIERLAAEKAQLLDELQRLRAENTRLVQSALVLTDDPEQTEEPIPEESLVDPYLLSLYAEVEAEQAAEAPEPEPAAEQLYTCSDCDQTLPASAYYWRVRKDGHEVPTSKFCKECAKARDRRARARLPRNPKDQGAAPKRPDLVAPDDPHPPRWSCPGCGSTAFTASISDPERCVLCVNKSPFINGKG